MELRAGCASFPITPPIPAIMGGYAARQGPADGVHDHLWARAIVIEAGETKAALVVADILAAPRSLVRDVRDRAGPILRLDPERIVVAATHTHSGPGIPPYPPEPDPVYWPWLSAALASALAMADRDLEPVRLGWGTASAAGLGGNRRDPEESVDDTATGLVLWRNDGISKGLLLGHACHPTVLGPDNRLLSADFPGAALEVLQRALGPGTWTCFAQGAAGDISCRFTRRGQTFAEVRRLGSILAGAGIDVMARAEPRDGLPLAVGSRTVVLPMRELPPPEAIRARVEEAEALVRDLQANPTDSGSLRLAQSVVEGSVAESLHAERWDELEHEAEIVAIRLGDAALVAVPGELFESVGRAIRERSPFAPTLIVGYANGYIGYVPDRGAYDSGGYEAVVTWLDRAAAETLVDEAAKLLSDLAEVGAGVGR
jgi:neutral/alkaline ceramidase-like enzyme